MVLTYSLIIAVAVVLFLMIGQHIRTQRQYEKKSQADKVLYQQVLQGMSQELSSQDLTERYGIDLHYNLLQSIKEKTAYPVTNNSEIRLLKNGEEKFPALMEACNGASHHIHLLYYTLRSDHIGEELLQILKRKAQEGIQVRLLIDGVGSKDLAQNQQKLEEIRQSGIKCHIFSPTRISFLLNLNLRNHRKIAVIDGEIGFTGGLNVGDEYLHKDPQKGYWRDIHCQVKGEAALLLQHIFATDWYYVTEEMLEMDRFFPRGAMAADTKPILAQVVPSGPIVREQTHKKITRDMILWAKDRVWLTTPYFVPDENLMHALLEAKAKGKDVRIIVPSKTDNPLVQAAAYHYYQQLLKAGIRIYLYKKGFYHAKMILLDNEVAAISSCNLDRRSFRLSFEAGLFVYNKDFNQEVEEIFTQDFKDCELLSPKQIANRSVTQRAGTWLALPLTPWL